MENKTHTLYISEFIYVLHSYPCELLVTETEYKGANSGTISIDSLCEKYDIEYYGYSDSIYHENKFDEYRLEVSKNET